jgi:hypothetical protein
LDIWPSAAASCPVVYVSNNCEEWSTIHDAIRELYQALGGRELAEQHLAKHKQALDAAGWMEGKIS